MRKSIHVLLIAMLILFNLSSCSKDENELVTPEIPNCQEGIIDLGTIDLESSSRNFIPYANEQTRIIFKNETGEEVVFEPHPNGERETYIEREFQLNCQVGSNNEYVFQCHFLINAHYCERLDLKITLQLNTQPAQSYPVFGDQLIVAIRSENPDINSNIYTQMASFKNYYLEQDDFFHFFEFTREYHESISLNGKEFKHVSHSSKTGINDLKSLYYNVENGIIGFTDEQDNLWVFDRFE